MLSIEGFAIVSAEGMLAGADGLMPNSLKFDEDQHFLDESLDRAALIVHGRMSHEAQGNSHRRRRLLLTSKCGPFSIQAVEPNVWLWNPAVTPFDEARLALGVEDGVIAITGGTRVYDMFLPVYRAFHLARADRVNLPGGVPVFCAVNDGLSPGDVLRGAGLARTENETLNAAQGLRRETWVRRL